MNKTTILLLLIIIIAGLLRTAFLHVSPPRMTHDEMSIGYNAYSILKTGRDEWGRLLPLDFEAFGDHKLPAYIYATVPFVAIFGLGVFSTKLVSVLSGIILIPVIYLLSKHVFKKEPVSLLAALFIAINPWPVHISRMALESNLALMFFYTGLLFLALGTSRHKKFVSIFSALFLSLSMYAYISYRMLVPLLVLAVLALALLWRVYLVHMKTWLITLAITILPLLATMFGTSGTARFNTVSIFTNPGVVMEIDEKRAFIHVTGQDVLAPLSKLTFNKIQNYSVSIFKNWLEFVSPSFLFISGDKNTYLSVPGYGEYLLVLVPFYVVGILVLFMHRFKEKSLVGLLAFVGMIAPIPSAMTGYPQIVRGSALLPIVAILIALGIEYVYQKAHRLAVKYAFTGLLTFCIFFFMLQYYQDYFFIYPAQYDFAAYPIDRRLAEYVRAREDKYRRIVVDSQFPDAYILFAFYNKIDPFWLQGNIVRGPKDSVGFSHPVKMGKYEFIDMGIVYNWCNQENSDTLLVRRPQEEVTPTAIFYNYAKVHPQYKAYTCPDEIINGPPEAY